MDDLEPEVIIAGARNVLNLNQPVAVMLLGILGHATGSTEEMRSIIGVLMDAVPSGSYLVLNDGVDLGDENFREACRGRGYTLRTLDEFRSCVAGMDLVEPGLVPVNRWRPRLSNSTDKPVAGHVVVARKP